MRPKLQALSDQFEARTFGNDEEGVIPYRLFKPDANQKYPLVVYFHGSGGRGRDNLKQITRGSLYGPRVWALPENQDRNPCFVLAPQLMKGPALWRDMKVWGEKVSDPSDEVNSIVGTWIHMLEIPAGETEMELVLKQEGEKWTGTIQMKSQKFIEPLEVVYEDPVLTYQSFGRIAIQGRIAIAGNTFKGTASRLGGQEVGPRLMALIEQTVEEFNIDRDRIYIIGQSGGGANTWGMLALYPDFFAAAVPLCGRADVKSARTIVEGNVPVWVFHGAIDHLIPVEASRLMVDALKKAGGQPRYTEFPGVKHDVWVDAFPDPRLHTWLFEQRRKEE
jgi:predicted peptidase